MDEFCLLLAFFAVANDERRTQLGTPLPDGPSAIALRRTPRRHGNGGGYAACHLLPSKSRVRQHLQHPIAITLSRYYNTVDHLSFCLLGFPAIRLCRLSPRTTSPFLGHRQQCPLRLPVRERAQVEIIRRELQKPACEPNRNRISYTILPVVINNQPSKRTIPASL